MRIYFHSAILAKHIRHFKAQIYAEAESNANELVQFASSICFTEALQYFCRRQIYVKLMYLW